jgi:rubrerythrin
VVLSTKKNLESAEAQSAGGEQDMMYSMFIVEARGEGAEDAVRTFRYAVSATAQQAILFRDAIRNLPMTRGASHIYYVCGACGAISDLPGGEMCPVCMSHEDPYEHIS